VTTIAVFGSFAAVPSADALRAALPDDRVVSVQNNDASAAAEAECALGTGDPDRIRAILASAPKLRWMHSASAGVDGLLIPELLAREDILFTNNTGTYDVPIAEHALAMIFAAAKEVPQHVAAQRRHEWRRRVRHAELRDATLVILGLGSIGGELARLASGVGMRVTGVRRDASRPVPGVERVVPPERFAAVAPEADHLAVTAALTPLTRGMVSAAIIASLKPTAWVINVARGAIVDEAALLDALRERRIGGAALDVFETEPLPAASPLWELDNVILTPHTSHSSPRLQERSLALALENIRRFKAGEPLLNVVDRVAGY